MFRLVLLLVAAAGAAQSYNINDMPGPYPPGPGPYPPGPRPEPYPDPRPQPYPPSPLEKCYFGEDEMSWYEKGANDVVVVEQPDGQLRSTQFNVKLPRNRSWGQRVLYINGVPVQTETTIEVSPRGAIYFHRNPNTCSFTSNELRAMNLLPGKNSGLLKVQKPWREIWLRDVTVQFNIYFYSQESRFVAFDLDDVEARKEHGYVVPEFELTERKPDAIEMLDKIHRNGYNPFFVTSRPYLQGEEIRYHLFETLQGINGYSVPEGPIFMAPKAFQDSVTNVYKTMHLINFQQLFFEPEEVFQGAYGHFSTDSDVFVDAGISTNFTFLIDSRDGKMYNLDTKEETSYREQADIVDIIYPRLPASTNIHIALIFAKLMFRLAEVCQPATATAANAAVAATTAAAVTLTP